MRLFSYCIPIDDGAAPNPFWGVCTLAICKPVIRRVAEKGDWIAGVGSKNVNEKDYSGKLVYAMKVTDKMTMEEYDKYCKKVLINRIPDLNHKDYRRKVGDSIYDFQLNPKGQLRDSVHSLSNVKTDLGGKYVLLSEHFYYFGDKAVCIPPEHRGIIKQGQGHQSNKNEPYKQEFLLWLESRAYALNELHGNPQIKLNFRNKKSCEKCSNIRSKWAKEDEILCIK